MRIRWKTRGNEKRMIIGFIVASITVQVLFYGGIIFTIVHFIRRFW